MAHSFFTTTVLLVLSNNLKLTDLSDVRGCFHLIAALDNKAKSCARTENFTFLLSTDCAPKLRRDLEFESKVNSLGSGQHLQSFPLILTE